MGTRGMTRRDMLRGVALTGVSVLGAGVLSGCSSSAKTGSAGTSNIFEGVGTGIHGEVKVAVTINGGTIEAIDPIEWNETDGLKQAAWDTITAEVLARQTVEVDTVSGATMASLGLISAIEDAVNTSGVILSPVEQTTDSAPQSTKADAVVVGSGSAGLFTARCLADAGYSVIVVERNGLVGGTGLLCDALLSNSLSKRDAEYSQSMIKKIVSFGVGLEDRGTFPFPNGTENRVYTPRRFQGGHAYSMINALTKQLEELGVMFLMNTQCTGLIVEDNAVAGINASRDGSTFEIRSKATVLACGGFARNKDLIAKYLPQYTGMSASGGVGSKGDVYGWIEGLDISTTALNSSGQMYPISPVNRTGAYDSGAYPLNVDSNGDTFCDLTTFYSDACKAAWDHDKNGTFYAVHTEEMAKAFLVVEYLEEKVATGVCQRYDSVKDIVSSLGLTNLQASLDKNSIPTSAHYYVSAWKPAIYSTYGGIDVDAGGRVITTSGGIVKGLYGAGEICGSEAVKEGAYYYGQFEEGMTMGMCAAESIAADIR